MYELNVSPGVTQKPKQAVGRANSQKVDTSKVMSDQNVSFPQLYKARS